MGDAMYQVGTAVEFPAQHVMPGVEGPEGTLHSHDYRLEVLLERRALDERGMVCDLDVLDAALAGIDSTVRGRNLDEIRPPEAEAVTVEVFARWAHSELARALAGSGVERIDVRVYENRDAFGGYSAPPD
jgi:6-pyruvoyltetrahydropterin/6-carboxytetrahydropterin synthase